MNLQRKIHVTKIPPSQYLPDQVDGKENYFKLKGYSPSLRKLKDSLKFV